MLRKIILSSILLCSSFGGYAEISSSSIPKEATTEVFIDSEGSKIFCQTMGKGEPLIVIHGGPGLSQDYLLPQLKRLAENHFVIFYDQRGSGRSLIEEINEETMNTPAMVRDLENVRKAFGLKKVSLLGHSWGGFLAMNYAIEHPEYVDKLILSNSAPASSEEFSLFVKEYFRRVAPIEEEMTKIQSLLGFQKGDPEIYEPFERMVLATYCHDPKAAEQLNLRRSSSAVINGNKINQLFFDKTFGKPFDLHGDLKQLRIPTLVIHGDDDVVPFITAQHVHESIPDSKFVLLKDCGHFPYVEQPEIYFQSLREFLGNE